MRTTRSERYAALLRHARHACLALLAIAPALHAQDTSAVAAQQPVRSCDGQIISSITIHPQSPPSLGRPGTLRRFVSGVLLQYSTTQPRVVQSFLQLKEGGICTEHRRAETERVLRAQPFLANAIVTATPDSAGGVAIDVTTVDEISLVLGASFSGLHVTSFKFGNSNIAGSGQYAAASWEQGDAYRDGFGARYVNDAAFSSPQRLTLDAGRDPVGSHALVALEHPFYTNLQHVAWHTGMSYTNSYPGFDRVGDDPLALGMHYFLADAGAVSRLDIGARRVFLGAVLTHERMSTHDRGVVISDSGYVHEPDNLFGARYPDFHATRLSAVAGVRLLHYERVTGYDALYGTQDFPLGVQLAGQIGRGLPHLGNTNWLFGGDVLGGHAFGPSFLGTRLSGEIQRDAETGGWAGLVTTARLIYYAKPGAHHTVIVTGDFAGAWRSLLPYELTINSSRSGVRGFRGSQEAGAQRAVARVEDRWAIRRFGTWSAIGAALFADAGKVWAGDVPYGVSSPVRASVGVSLLAAVPAQSQTTWRVDIAAPLDRGAGAHRSIEIRFVSENRARSSLRQADDLSRARAGTAATNIFSWQ
jgi:Omp85 superfamily domain